MSYFYSKFDLLVQNFGFIDLSDFLHSLFHPKMLFLTIPTMFTFSALILFVETWFGLSYTALVGFVVAAILELVTGLWASRVKGHSWESRKASRFGLKIVVYLGLMLVVNTFKLSFADASGFLNPVVNTIFYVLHTLLVVFVSFEYIISILENLSTITGKSNNKLLQFMKKLFDKLLGYADTVVTNQLPQLPKEEKKNESIEQPQQPKDGNIL